MYIVVAYRNAHCVKPQYTTYVMLHPCNFTFMFSVTTPYATHPRKGVSFVINSKVTHIYCYARTARCFWVKNIGYACNIPIYYCTLFTYRSTPIRY